MVDQDHNSDPEAARAKLIELFEDEEWRIERRALKEGCEALRWLRDRQATECEIIDYITKSLQNGVPLERVELTNYMGVGWVMKHVDGRDIYIKLQVAEDGIRYRALVLSCHLSVHKKK